MSWLGKALGIIGKVGGIASQFAGHSGWLGRGASTISKVANIATTFLPKAMPYVSGAIALGKIAYKSGLLDKITNGGASRLVNGIQNTFGLNKPSSISNSIQSARPPG